MNTSFRSLLPAAAIAAALILTGPACQQGEKQQSAAADIRYELPSVDYRRMSDWRRNSLKGEVRSLERWLTQTAGPDGTQITDSVLLERTIFNEQGWMVRAEQYNTDGVMQIVIERTFDSSGLLTRAIAQMPTTNELQQTSYVYDADGRLVEYRLQGTREGAAMSAVMSFLYDEKGRCTEELIRDNSGQLASKTVRTFDANGNVLEEVVTDGRDRTVSRTRFEEKNRVILNTFDTLQTMQFNRDIRFSPEKAESVIVSGYSSVGYSMITKQIGPAGLETRRIVIDPTGVDTSRYDLDYQIDANGNWQRKTIRLLDQTPDPNLPQVMVELQHAAYFQ